MTDIETLITHFVGVSWGPVIPAGEAWYRLRRPREQWLYLISDGSTSVLQIAHKNPVISSYADAAVYKQRIHFPDLLAILGAMDFVLADLDR